MPIKMTDLQDHIRRVTRKFLKGGGDAAQLKGKQADSELTRQIIRIDE